MTQSASELREPTLEAPAVGQRARRVGLRLSVPARPASLPLVRQLVGQLASFVGAGGETGSRILLSVTEACSNVVRHAYRGGDGSIEVEAASGDDGLVVQVSDTGVGRAAESGNPGSGAGLELMEALSDSVEIRDRAPHGTQVELRFSVEHRDAEAASSRRSS